MRQFPSQRRVLELAAKKIHYSLCDTNNDEVFACTFKGSYTFICAVQGFLRDGLHQGSLPLLFRLLYTLSFADLRPTRHHNAASSVLDEVKEHTQPLSSEAHRMRRHSPRALLPHCNPRTCTQKALIHSTSVRCAPTDIPGCEVIHVKEIESL